jgi:hypothetical protein
MIERREAREILLDLMEESALVVAGVLVVHKLHDDVVWKLMKGLDDARRGSLARLDEAAGEGQPNLEAPVPSAHPAVEEFLIHIQRDRRRCANQAG